MNNHVAEVKAALIDGRKVCEQLGLLVRGAWKPQPRGAVVRCVWHDDTTPSLSVRQAENGEIACVCHGCGRRGDVLALIAAVRGLSETRDFHEVLCEGAELAGLHSVLEELAHPREKPSVPRVQAPRSEPAPPREYPPKAEVLALWDACRPVADDVETAAWLRGRAIDPDQVEVRMLARALPGKGGFLTRKTIQSESLGGCTAQGATLPTSASKRPPAAKGAGSPICPRWASYQGQTWPELGYRLLVAMLDHAGEIRSVRGCRVVEGDSPKRLPPGGYRASGLVMACELGAAMLRGTFAPKHIVVAEGEPDFLSWGTQRMPHPTAVIGIVSGAWTKAIADRVPTGATVVIRTDGDEAGERYAKEVTETIGPRCFLRRSREG